MAVARPSPLGSSRRGWCRGALREDVQFFVLIFALSAANLDVDWLTIRHRVSPEFIESRNCVPTAFTAESPSARGQ